MARALPFEKALEVFNEVSQACVLDDEHVLIMGYMGIRCEEHTKQWLVHEVYRWRLSPRRKWAWLAAPVPINLGKPGTWAALEVAHV